MTIKYGSLADMYPNIAAEWDNEKNTISPTEVTAHAGKRAFWRCEKGHTWEARIIARTLKGTDCPYCAGQRPIPGETDLMTVRPDIAAEWDYEKNEKSPTEYTSGSGVRVSWCCYKGHKWETRICNRTSNGTGCPYCAGRRPILGETDLMTVRPILQLNGIMTRISRHHTIIL